MTKLLASANPSLKGLRPWERKNRLRSLQAPTPNASQHSLLLDLPPELRNRVYEFALINQHRIDIDASHNVTSPMTRSRTKVKRSDAVITEPPLLRTCQIVRHEATQMYYGLNVFKCRARLLFYRWLECIGAAKRAMLKDVRCSRRHMTRRTDPWANPKMLVDIQRFESELAAHGMDLKDGVLRGYMKDGVRIFGGWGSGTARTKSEIEAAMTEEQWKAYHLHISQLERNARLRDGALRRQRSAAPEAEGR